MQVVAGLGAAIPSGYAHPVVTSRRGVRRPQLDLREEVSTTTGLQTLACDP